MKTPKHRDRTGEAFGRLTVLFYGGPRLVRNRMRATWHCRCSCGTEKIIDSDSLPKVKSCGCLRRELGAARLAALPRRPVIQREPRPSVPRAPRTPNFDEARARSNKRKVKPRSYHMVGKVGREMPSWSRKIHLDGFGPTGEREAWLERMAGVGRALSEEWARMTRAGKRRTSADAFAPEHERWV
jgi:hypothetical protein